MTNDSPAALWRRLSDDGAVVLDGFHAVKHAVRFGATVELVLSHDRTGVRQLSADLAADVTERIDRLTVDVSREELQALVPRPHATGIAALARRPQAVENLRRLADPFRPAPIVLLDRPRNLGNVGAVVRLAAGFGATGVVTTGELDPWHPNVLRGAAGLHYATAVERVTAEALPPGPLYALDPEGEPIHGLTLPDDAVLAFGSERHGLSPEVRAAATALVAIPMRPHVSSFNLATSVAMALFHWQSQGAAR